MELGIKDFASAPGAVVIGHTCGEAGGEVKVIGRISEGEVGDLSGGVGIEAE